MTTKIKLASNVSDVDVTTTAPTDGQSLVYSTASAKWIPGAAAGGGVTVYATINDLPLSGVSTGDLALVDSTNKLYLWMDTGWYNIATINTNPSITSGNNTPYLLATDGTPTEITLIASDPEGIPLTWSYEVTSGSLTNGGGTTATVSNVDNVFTVTPTTTEAYAGVFSLTFKASDGVNLGTTVAAFTLAFRIPNSNYTTLLAKGTAATQNATFVDSSTNAHTITRNGDVYQGTFSPYREGGYSMYFDGTGDYLTTSSTVLNFGTSDFTIELWAYNTDLATTNIPLTNDGPSRNIGSVTFIISANGTGFGIQRITSTSGTAETLAYSSAGSVLENTWNHFAVTKVGTTIQLFLNGALVSTQTSAYLSWGNQIEPAQIGRRAIVGYEAYVAGYISNLRVVKGTAVYTSNFTPPTAPLEAITNTSLLINTPYIADSSANAHAITVNGNTSTKPFSPFDYRVYDAAVNGGSVSFPNVAGSYLSLSTSSTTLNMGTDAFTVEAWVYLNELPTSNTFTTATGGYQNLFGTGPNNSATGSQLYFGVTNVFFDITNDGGGPISVAHGIKAKTWNHVAITRSGNTFYVFINGVLKQTGTSSSSWVDGYGWGIGGSEPFSGFSGAFFNGYISDFRVVKGTALYTAAFNPPTSPVSSTGASLKLNFTNAGIQDYSQVSDLKLVGNATGSNTQTKNASYSMYMPAGDLNYALIPSSSITTIGTDKFTVEFWMLIPAGFSADNYGRVIEQGAYDAINTWRITRNNTVNSMVFQIGNPTTRPEIITSTVMSNDTWYHVAVVRDTNNTITMYINGTSEGTPLTNRTDSFISSDILLGIGGGNHLECYIEDLRITKGLARYTANFTPPTTELLG